jgi:hypothetical protein
MRDLDEQIRAALQQELDALDFAPDPAAILARPPAPVRRRRFRAFGALRSERSRRAAALGLVVATAIAVSLSLVVLRPSEARPPSAHAGWAFTSTNTEVSSERYTSRQTVVARALRAYRQLRGGKATIRVVLVRRAANVVAARFPSGEVFHLADGPRDVWYVEAVQQDDAEELDMLFSADGRLLHGSLQPKP